MCQVEEDDLETVKKSENSDGPLSACVKCGADSVIHLRDEDHKCSACFVASVTQKFRAVLSKHQVSKSRDRVIVAVSGGPASAALLGLLCEATTGAHHSRLAFVPVILHIDEGLSREISPELRRANVTSVFRMVTSVHPKWQMLYSSLEMVFSSEEANLTSVCTVDDDIAFDPSLSCTGQMEKLLQSLKSITATEELLKTLRSVLLRNIARQLGIDKVLVGDTLDRLAVQVITNTSLGKGKHLPLELGYLDTRYSYMTIVRPFKEISIKEVLMYNKICGITCGEMEACPVKNGAAENKPSVYTLTRQFVEGLQKDFPQTISTLCRTGDKLCATTAQTEKAGKKDLLCDFCSGPLDASEPNTCTAENSIGMPDRFSRVGPVDLEDLAGVPSKCGDDETKSCRSENTNDSGCGSGDGCCQTKIRPLPLAKLCYSCRWIIGEIKDISLLPARLTSASTEQNRRHLMRESIKEFLLDVDEDV